MGAYQNMKDILKVLRNDEELLRLLYYSPKDISKSIPDPLDPSLPNILDKPPLELVQLQNKLILVVPKDDDIIGDRKCVLFAYLGDRRANGRNYIMADQNLVIDVYNHVDFENGDYRSAKIGDRLDKLFSLERVTGIGKTDFERSGCIARVPSQYVAYRHVYEFGGTKK